MNTNHAGKELLSKTAGININDRMHACHLYNNEEECLKFINCSINNIDNNAEVLIIKNNIDNDFKELITLDNVELTNSSNVLKENQSSIDYNKLFDLIKRINRQSHKKSLILLSWDWDKFESQQIVEHEIEIDQSIPDNCSLICQYNKNRLSYNILKKLYQIHPLVINNDHIEKNVYYGYPPELQDDHKNNFEVLDLIKKTLNQHKTKLQASYKIDYKKLFRNSNDAIFIHTVEGQILEINRKASDLLKLDKEDLIGKNVKQLSPPDKFAKAKQALQVTVNIGHFRFETEFINSKQERIPVEINSRIIDKSEGIIKGSVRDIKDRKSIEEELIESEYKYRQLVETTGDIILQHDSEGKITFINQAGLKYIGYPKEDFITKNVKDLIPEKELVKLQKRKEKRLHGDHEHYHYETQFFNKKGELIDVDVNSTSILDNGKYQGSLLVARVITERKQAQRAKKRIEKQKHQTQRLETLGTLAGGIGHDFNNILTPILGYSEIIQQNLNQDNPNYKFIGEIMKGCLRAKDLISQMLSFSRDEEQDKRPLNIIPIIKEALKLLRPSIPRTIKITRDLQEPCPLINADPTRIHQVIMNLCTNAYQAMETKGGILNIALETIHIDSKNSRKYIDLEEGKYIKLVISDNGPGMDKETKKHIFEPFYTTKEEGTGMGLAVVHGIVKSHNGRINVYSEKGKGTTFNIYLPIIESGKSVEIESNFTIQRGAGTILLVDDREEVTDTLQQMLISLGYEVYVVNSSQNALEIVNQHKDKFDLLITDYIMPDMTGVELANKINTMQSSLPKIMISGHRYQMNSAQLKDSGIKKILNKPVLIPDLAKAIHVILNAKDTKQE